MYGYPEQFIPQPDGAPPVVAGATPAPAVTAAMGSTPRPATIET